MKVNLVKAAPWLVVAGMFLLWELICVGFEVPEFLLPAPSAVWKVGVEQFEPIMMHATQTFITTLAGFAIAVAVGLLIGIFAANWPGPALTEPRVYMMGFHPSASFTTDEYNRVHGILEHADLYRASQHAGPVVYAVLRDLPTVWPTTP